jgi:hypothetical protein
MHVHVKNSSYQHFLSEVMKPENLWWVNLEVKNEGVTPHEWTVGGERVEFKDLIRYMEDLREGKVEMSDPYETLIVAIYVLYKADCLFAEISSYEVSWELIENLLDDKIREFCEYLPERDVEALLKLDTVEKVKIVPELRNDLKRNYAIYNRIDGEKMRWWENVYDPAALTLDDIPVALQEKIDAALSVPIQADRRDYKAYFREATERFLSEKENALPLLEIIIKHLIDDEYIGGADSSILVGPRFILPDAPWEMTTDDYLFCIVYLKEDYDPVPHGLKASRKLIQDMVATRMFVDKIRKAHYYNPDEQVRYAKAVAHLTTPDISNFQHVHQVGHAAAGVRATVRAPFPVHVEHNGELRAFTGFSDIRLFRSLNENEFTTEALFRTITYSKWVKEVFDVTFKNGKRFTETGVDREITFFARGGRR